MSDLSATWGVATHDLRGGDRVTIADVARAAGVNKGTASRALRGFPNVGSETRARILAAADRLRFSASPIATALATGRSSTVGIVLPTLRSWYFREVASGASEVLMDAGYRVELVNLDVDSDTIEADAPEFRHFLAELGTGRDALLFAGSVPDDRGDQVQVRVPVLAVGSSVSSVRGLAVDHRRGTRLLTEHLVGLGHRDLVVVDGRRVGLPDHHVWDRRTEGVRDVLAAHGWELPTDDVLRAGDCTADDGEAAVAAMLATGRRPTAIVCHSDELAFGALSALRRAGLHCPADVSVVGFDDHPMSRFWGLTTIDQRAHAQGEQSALALLVTLQPERAGTPGSGSEPGPAMELVVRETTAPPPASPARAARVAVTAS